MCWSCEELFEKIEAGRWFGPRTSCTATVCLCIVQVLMSDMRRPQLLPDISPSQQLQARSHLKSPETDVWSIGALIAQMQVCSIDVGTLTNLLTVLLGVDRKVSYQRCLDWNRMSRIFLKEFPTNRNIAARKKPPVQALRQIPQQRQITPGTDTVVEACGTRGVLDGASLEIFSKS